MSTIQDMVEEAVRNAKENGHNVLEMTDLELAEDLQSFDSDLEGVGLTNLLIAIKTLRGKIELDPEAAKKIMEAVRSKPYGGKVMPPPLQDFLDAEASQRAAHTRNTPEGAVRVAVNPDPMAGVLHDRTVTHRERNAQTLAETNMPVADRPTHYSAGLPATLCEVYMAAKQTTDKARVTCVECQRLMRKTGR